MDLKVLEVQKWLNLTYGNHPDFPAVTEDGLTVHFALFGGRKCVLERSLCGA